MSRSLIVGATVVLIFVVGLGIAFPRQMGDYEPIAVWLEGIALVVIFIWDRVDALDQQRESQKQYELSRTTANASQRSASVLADLHRPFIGLLRTSFGGVPGTTERRIEYLIKNYGTLPANGVKFSAEVFVDGALRWSHLGNASVEVFPQDTSQIFVPFNAGLDFGAILQNKKQLHAKISIFYAAGDSRRFEYTAEVSYPSSGFEIMKSNTIERE
jgi:hypothetical protein